MQMLSRWMAGLLHPLIHTGYGAEFGLLGMLAEGLAQAAIHPAAAPVLTPPSLFKYAITTSSDTVNASVSRLTALLPSLVLDKAQQTLSSHGVQTAKEPSVHALTVLAQILHNRDFSLHTIGLPTEDKDDNNALKRVIELRGEQLVALAEAWTVDGTNAEEVAGKIEELTLMNVLMYGVGGWAGRETSKTKQFNADFFLLHLVTSVLFLPSLAAYLSPSSSSILLRSYFLNSLAWYVARGRPALPIRDFYVSVLAHPREHGAPHTAPGKGTLVTSDPSPNPWVPIVQTTLMHPDDHLCKLQRALAHFDRMWGTRQAGYLERLAQVGGAPLEGAELLDGTLWLRVAGLSADRLGWMREGEENQGWDFHGFYE
ncbi:hypothetical protein WOLCODRAFT_139493 [Wolfiporia cocos MD-104 SS10]|uniref:Uncharacterized protein n=1 Tax=Wolfiporia cocos (strain MD-104) TaxID=742152 RepID=A0A2H3IZ05_WOLCO|nr:hypothetical protein WOLCODRAFT_139493 [Wolfiporia cocos MD-104 SS10]